MCIRDRVRYFNASTNFSSHSSSSDLGANSFFHFCNNIRSVSYTHLDVYKRQLFFTPSPISLIASSWLVCPFSSQKFRSGIPDIFALLHAAISLSPCSPIINAWTERLSTCKCRCCADKSATDNCSFSAIYLCHNPPPQNKKHRLISSFWHNRPVLLLLYYLHKSIKRCV